LEGNGLCCGDLKSKTDSGNCEYDFCQDDEGFCKTAPAESQASCFAECHGFASYISNWYCAGEEFHTECFIDRVNRLSVTDTDNSEPEEFYSEEEFRKN